MAKVLCGLIMCQHNSKNTPKGLGTCMCKEKIKLKYNAQMKAIKHGGIWCDHFNFMGEKCSEYNAHQIFKNKTIGKWEVANGSEN